VSTPYGQGMVVSSVRDDGVVELHLGWGICYFNLNTAVVVNDDDDDDDDDNNDVDDDDRSDIAKSELAAFAGASAGAGASSSAGTDIGTGRTGVKAKWRARFVSLGNRMAVKRGVIKARVSAGATWSAKAATASTTSVGSHLPVITYDADSAGDRDGCVF
jgi:hypothetical protein